MATSRPLSLDRASYCQIPVFEWSSSLRLFGTAIGFPHGVCTIGFIPQKPQVANVPALTVLPLATFVSAMEFSKRGYLLAFPSLFLTTKQLFSLPRKEPKLSRAIFTVLLFILPFSDRKKATQALIGYSVPIKVSFYEFCLEKEHEASSMHLYQDKKKARWTMIMAITIATTNVVLNHPLLVNLQINEDQLFLFSLILAPMFSRHA